MLAFRVELSTRGIKRGYQWIDGSFLENIEVIESRPPEDLDVLTVFWGCDLPFLNDLAGAFPAFIDRDESKRLFRLDHFPMQADASPESTVENARYWIQLFSHRRDGIWKGMLKISLGTEDQDAHALSMLGDEAK